MRFVTVLSLFTFLGTGSFQPDPLWSWFKKPLVMWFSHPQLPHLITLMVWCDFQSDASCLDQIFGGEEQVLQTETHVVLHGLIVTLQLAPLLLLLQDDTMDQPQALPQSFMQQPDLLLRARLLSIVGQGDDAPLVRGVVR